MHAVASARKIVRATAVFQIERNAIRSFGGNEASDGLVGPAAMIAVAILAENTRRTSLLIVLSVMDWPSTMNIGLAM